MSLAETWNDPHARHAMLVHMPIVLGTLSILPIAGYAISKLKNTTLAITAIVMLVMASIGAGLAAGAGEEAEEKLEEAVALTALEKAVIHEHEEMGEGGWMWPLIPAVLLAGAVFIPKTPVRWGAVGLALVASAGVGVWVARTAHAGGQLVYVYGLGVPGRSVGPGAGPGVGVTPGNATETRSDSGGAAVGASDQR